MAKVFDLQSANYTEVQYTAGGTIAAGAFVTLNDLYGFTLVDVVSGDVTTLVVKAEKVKCARTAATACSAGEKAYYHSGTGLVDNVATAGILIGHLREIRRPATPMHGSNLTVQLIANSY